MGILKQGSVGRPPGEIIYTDIDYNDSKYVVMTILKNDIPCYSVIDFDDYETVNKYSWHIASGYLGSAFVDNGKRKELYLHNLVMNRLTFNGKGQTETIDHISRNLLDNRKTNLHLISQSEQNLNQKTKERSFKFPEEYTLDPNDIPKHIWYVKANGGHGDRFAIELKTENFIWKGTSSKKVKIEDKLIEAKEKLKDVYIKYPYLDPDNLERKIQIETLQKEYNAIIKMI